MLRKKRSSGTASACATRAIRLRLAWCIRKASTAAAGMRFRSSNSEIWRGILRAFRGGDQERGGGGVAVALDVAKEAILGNGERLRHAGDQVEIGLVHQEGLHSRGGDAEAFLM